MDELIALASKKYNIDLKKDVELLKLKLPYCGVQEGCKNLKYSGGLYTQCCKNTEKDYCKVCQIEVNNGGNKYGNTDDREKVSFGKFVANNGKEEIDYNKYMKSHGYSKEMVIEAANLREIKLPENLFEKKTKSKEEKRNVEVSDTSSECSSSENTKRGRGRPKKEEKKVEVEKDESKELVIDEELKIEENEDDSEDEIEVKKFEYKGKQYLRDINDNTLYTTDGEVVGVYNEDTDSIDE
jgi:hypothetical protein